MKLVVRKSRIGLGAFATESIAKGEVIVDWSKHPFFQIPPQIPRNWKFVQIAPGVYSGPVGPEEHPDAYLNHSCTPSAEILFERPKVHLVALRDIPSGEEVTFDYATLYDAPWSMKCQCGASVCRGVIRGKG
jgi:SET domain-containing protein